MHGQLVVAIVLGALFDFEAENEVFEAGDDRAYMACSRPGSTSLRRRGWPSLVKKLLAFNADGEKRVEVVVLSRNDPISGCACSAWRRTTPCPSRARRLHARASALALSAAAVQPVFLSANDDDVRQNPGSRRQRRA